MTTKAVATIEDLYSVPDDGKAEIVNGELVLISHTGDEPGYAGDKIIASLRDHVRARNRSAATCL